ncbi:MAG: hypothetical protein JWQ61_2850 [Collimonas fungivorans]|uniref:tail fiber assembly protein n=1 Tax=Collimonas fungivorans TaxID=158899 RepID=UPI0026E98D2F|nr:tail fiber assembly protein [Collimonas fungivorans]MDB5768036.1 hypothetical protein [Collimonas fungivorans]
MEMIEKPMELVSENGQHEEITAETELPIIVDPMPIPASKVVVPPQLPAPAIALEQVDPFAYSEIKNIVRLPNGYRCSVKFDARDDYLTFLACEDDIEIHGRAIYAECKSGKRGPAPDYFPTHTELLDAALSRIARELRRANDQVTKYQDRVDVEVASDDDVIALKAWKKYRVNLNRVPEQTHFPHPVVWPVAPDDASTALVSA